MPQYSAALSAEVRRQRLLVAASICTRRTAERIRTSRTANYNALHAVKPTRRLPTFRPSTRPKSLSPNVPAPSTRVVNPGDLPSSAFRPQIDISRLAGPPGLIMLIRNLKRQHERRGPSIAHSADDPISQLAVTCTTPSACAWNVYGNWGTVCCAYGAVTGATRAHIKRALHVRTAPTSGRTTLHCAVPTSISTLDNRPLRQCLNPTPSQTFQILLRQLPYSATRPSPRPSQRSSLHHRRSNLLH